MLTDSIPLAKPRSAREMTFLNANTMAARTEPDISEMRVVMIVLMHSLFARRPKSQAALPAFRNVYGRGAAALISPRCPSQSP